MIAPWLAVFAVVVGISFALVADEFDKKMSINDINVGDKIKIKGETFTVKGYSSNSLMELEKSPGVTFIIKFDDDVQFMLIKSSGTKPYIEVKNFKGTVGGQYLNNIKI